MSAASWGSVELKVTPETLKEQAAEVSRRIEKLTSRFAELERSLQNTRGYWIGEAGDAHRKAYEDRKEELNVMLRRLREHPVDLLKMSGNYEETERTIMEEISMLSVNAIN